MTIKRRVSLLLLLSLELLGFLSVSGETTYEYEIEFDFEESPDQILCSLSSTDITDIEQVVTSSVIIVNHPNITFDSNHAIIEVIYPDCCSDSTCDDIRYLRRLQRSRYIQRFRFLSPPAHCYIGCPPLLLPPPPTTRSLQMSSSITKTMGEEKYPQSKTTCQGDITSVLKRAKVTNEQILEKSKEKDFLDNRNGAEVIASLMKAIYSPLQYANVVITDQDTLETYMDASRDIITTDRYTDSVYQLTTHATVIAPTFFQIQSLSSGTEGGDSPAFENRLCVQTTNKIELVKCNDSPKQRWRVNFQGQLHNENDVQCSKLDDNSACALFHIKGHFIKIKGMKDDQYLTKSGNDVVSNDLVLPRTFDQQWKLIYDEREDWRKISQPIYGPSPGDFFGKSLALSDDKSLLVVGTGTEIACRIQLFERKDYGWEEVYREETTGDSCFGGFATSVGIARNDDVVVLVIGSPKDDGKGSVIIRRWEQFTAEKNVFFSQTLQETSITTEIFASAVALSITGKYLVVAAEGIPSAGRVIPFRWDNGKFDEESDVSTGPGPICVAVSNANDEIRFVFGTFGRSSRVKIYQITNKGNKRESIKIPASSKLNCPVAFSGDGSVILVGAGNKIQAHEKKTNKKNKSKWKIQKNNQIPFEKLNEDEIKVAMSKDGSVVAIAISGITVSIFKEGKKLGQDLLLGSTGSHKAKVMHMIALSGDGKMLIVGDSLHSGNINFERNTGKVDSFVYSGKNNIW